MLRKIGPEPGFTLLELMVVLLIVAVLASMAIPRFMQAAIKSKQSEAKMILKQIYNMQQTYRQEFDSYWGDGVVATAAAPTAFARISVDIQLPARYSYSMVAAANTFTCTATSSILDDDPPPDIWVIDQTGNLQVTSDDVTLQ